MSFFHTAPDIAKIGTAPSRLSYKERERRLRHGLWTGQTGEVRHITKMASSHIYNAIQALHKKTDEKDIGITAPLQKTTSFNNNWVVKLSDELHSREDPHSKRLQVLLMLLNL